MIFTISMETWHGNFHKTEQGQGNDIESAVDAVLLTPAGRGYGPNNGTDQYNELVASLLLYGKHAWGWADYTLTTKGDK